MHSSPSHLGLLEKKANVCITKLLFGFLKKQFYYTYGQSERYKLKERRSLTLICIEVVSDVNLS